MATLAIERKRPIFEFLKFLLTNSGPDDIFGNLGDGAFIKVLTFERLDELCGHTGRQKIVN